MQKNDRTFKFDNLFKQDEIKLSIRESKVDIWGVIYTYT